MGYKITLNHQDILSLEWAAERGYFPSQFLEEMYRIEDSDEYKVPEHIAWDLAAFEELDPHAFLACMPTTVVDKVRKFMEQII